MAAWYCNVPDYGLYLPSYKTCRSDRGLPFAADEQRHSLSSEHQETDKTEKAQRQRSFLDELHINPSSFRLSLFGRHSGSGSTVALALSFLMFATMLCPAAGSLCVGKKEVVGMAVQKGQVVLDCPVAPGALQIKQSIIIAYVKSPTSHEEVLGCDWLVRSQDFDCLESRFGAKLIATKDDRVLATLPEDKLHCNGSYKCKLAPAGIDEQFPDCDISFPADPTTTTVRAVTMSATGDLRKPDDPQNRADAPSGGDEGLVTAVVVLSIVVLLLLLLLVLIVVRIFFLNFMMRGNKNAGKGRYAVANEGII